jgi:hypothetical protein
LKTESQKETWKEISPEKTRLKAEEQMERRSVDDVTLLRVKTGAQLQGMSDWKKKTEGCKASRWVKGS